MNKAFVREQELKDCFCPRCQSLGIAVGPQTLAAQLMESSRRLVADSAYFCTFATCEVAYFDAFERVALVDHLVAPIYPKDPAASICACFGFSESDIESDIVEGAPKRTRALLERAKSVEAQCLTCSPSGRSCVADVQRCYMKRRAEHAGE